MYYVKNERKGQEIYDPSINLAIEYYLLNEKQLDEPILLFYINQPSIIIGKNQNTRAEINRDYVEENDVKVVRRLSGGGAVYHDYGNVSYCFITEDDGDSFRNFQKFTQPVIDALHDMGVEGAQLKGRNDLVIDDKKFSGNAMYTTKGRMTSHGTLMWDVDLDEAQKVLKPKKEKLTSKGIKSIRSRMTNIRAYVDEEYKDISIEDFREKLLLHIFKADHLSEIKEYVLTEEDWEKILAWAAKYTANDGWNYGRNPNYQIVKQARSSVGQVEFHLDIHKEYIDDITVYGEFFGMGEITDVEDALMGIPYTEEALLEAFKKVDLHKYFGNITAQELVDIIK